MSHVFPKYVRLLCAAAAFAGLSCVSRQAGAQCGSAAQDLKVTSDQAWNDQTNFGVVIDIDGSTAVVGVPRSDFDGYEGCGAAYVYTLIGSQWVLQARLVASDRQAGDEFGRSVAVAGDRIAIGAPNNDAVYLFHRTGTLWSQGQKLTQSDSRFGSAVDLWGTTLVVGAPGYSPTGSQTSAGRAHVYSNTIGTTWSLSATFFSPNPIEQGNFGASVAISGSDIALCEPGLNRVRTFRNPGLGWVADQSLVPSPLSDLYDFADSVSIVGNTLLVGAPGRINGSNLRAGAGYVFTRPSAGGAWTEFQILVATDPKQDVRLGSTVQLVSETQLAMSAPGWVPVVATPITNGAAYTYSLAGGFWLQDEIIPYPLTPEGGAWFARGLGAVANGAGMRLLVGADVEDSTSGFRGGAVYAFDVSPSGAMQTQRFVEPLGINHQAGFAVAMSGEWAAVGIPYAEPTPPPVPGSASRGPVKGAVQMYRRVSGNWVFHSLVHDAGAETFGTALSIDGTTLAVGAPYTNVGDVDSGIFTDAGIVYVYAFDGTAWAQQAELTHPTPGNNDLFGRAVSVKGDRLLVGVPGDDTAAGANAGSAFTFTRSGGVWGDVHLVSPPDAAAGDEFGISVAYIGTANATGPYLVVGAYGDDDQGTNSGTATMFRQEPIVGGYFWDNVRKFIPADGQTGDNFGFCIAAAGNLIVFGSPLEDGSGTNFGAAYIFRNTGTLAPNWGTGTKIVGADATTNDRFGWSVATDGSTVIAGMPLDDNTGGADAGAGYIFRSVGGVWTEQQKFGAADRDLGDQFGYAVAVSGTTILAGAPFDDTDNGVDSGSAYFFDYALSTPTIASQPADGWACRPRSEIFSVVAAGGGPYTYQWKRNGVNLVNGPNVSGATTATLSLTNLVESDEGLYTCYVTSPCGAITSDPATLTVCPADFNCSGDVTVQDVYDFLFFWNLDVSTGSYILGDFNGSGDVTVQDIYDFLAAWNTGCN